MILYCGAALATGTTTITVTAKAYPEVSTSCVVTVTEEVGPDVPMEAFTLNRTGLSIEVGDVNTATRLYAYTPYTATNLEVTWSSSDESVATVDENGAITGVAAGTAVVTAKAVLPESDVVTTADADRIAKARAAYEALTPEQQAEVANYDKLVAAEEALKALDQLSFTDVQEENWFYPYVKAITKKGLVNTMLEMASAKAGAIYLCGSIELHRSHAAQSFLVLFGVVGENVVFNSSGQFLFGRSLLCAFLFLPPAGNGRISLTIFSRTES